MESTQLISRCLPYQPTATNHQHQLTSKLLNCFLCVCVCNRSLNIQLLQKKLSFNTNKSFTCLISLSQQHPNTLPPQSIIVIVVPEWITAHGYIDASCALSFDSMETCLDLRKLQVFKFYLRSFFHERFFGISSMILRP